MLTVLAHASRIPHDHGTLPSWTIAVAVVAAIVAIRLCWGRR